MSSLLSQEMAMSVRQKLSQFATAHIRDLKAQQATKLVEEIAATNDREAAATDRQHAATKANKARRDRCREYLLFREEANVRLDVDDIHDVLLARKTQWIQQSTADNLEQSANKSNTTLPHPPEDLCREDIPVNNHGNGRLGWLHTLPDSLCRPWEGNATPDLP